MTKGSNTGKAHSAKKRQDPNTPNPLWDDVVLLIVLAFCILLFLSLFHLAGRVGDVLNGFLFGMFGMVSYLVPVALFFAAAFYLSNRGKKVAWVKVVSALVLIVILCCFATLLFTPQILKQEVRTFYAACQSIHTSGGLLGCIFAWIFKKCIGNVATYVLLIVLLIISIVLITEKSFFKGVKKGSESIYHTARDDARRRRIRRQERQEARREMRSLREEMPPQDRVLRSDKKVSGVMLDTSLKPEKVPKDEIHEILKESEDQTEDAFDLKKEHSIRIRENEEFIDDYVDDFKAEIICPNVTIVG